MAKKFDIVKAVEDHGFRPCREYVCESGFKYVMYTKQYKKEAMVAWHGLCEIVFVADIIFGFNKSGELFDVTAQFSNGKVKSYKPGKRAYNAIRDTVKYNGFEI